MVWFGNAFVFFGVLLASWIGGFAVLGVRYQYYDFRRRPWQRENWPLSLAFSCLPLMVAISIVAMLRYVLTAGYRAIPEAFFWICGGVLIVSNVAIAIGCWSYRWAQKLSEIVRDWRHYGGFWGNWFSQRDNRRFPGTRSNFWGWQALWLWVAVFVAAGFHGGSWYFDIGDFSGWLSRCWTSIVATAREAYHGTFLDDLLGSAGAPAEPPSAAAVLPLYPRSDSWFWVSLATFIWAIFANLVCRRDQAFALGAWLWSWVSRKRTPAVVAGVTPAPSVTVPPTSLPAGPVSPPTVTAEPTSFRRELVKEIGAEAVVSAAGRVLVEGMPVVRRWLRRIGRGT